MLPNVLIAWAHAEPKVTKPVAQIPVADVAISFAAAEKVLADEISRRLKRRGVRVYHYEESPEIDLGSKLGASLERTYGEVRLVVVLHSCSYERSPHTAVELQAALGGRAAKGGIIVVRCDSTTLPSELEQLTWWSVDRGTDRLVQALLRLLGHRPLGGPIALVIASTATSALLVWFLAALGFRSLGRWPDVAFIATALLPMAWFASVRMLPSLVQRCRSRRSNLAVLMQSRVERQIDWLGPYLAWLVAGIAIVGVASGLVVQREIRTEQDAAAALVTDLEVEHRRYWQLMGEVTGLASRLPGSVPTLDVDAAGRLQSQYQNRLAAASVVGQTIRDRLQAVPSVSADPAVAEYETGMLDLERNGDRNLGYQVQRLAEALAPGVERSEAIHRRQLVAKILTDWNALFAHQLIECDERFADVRRVLKERRDAHAERWRGVVRDATSASPRRAFPSRIAPSPDPADRPSHPQTRAHP